MVLTTLYNLSIRSHLKPGVSANQLSSCGIGLGTSMIMSVDNFLRKLVPCLSSLHQPNWLACFFSMLGIAFCTAIVFLSIWRRKALEWLFQWMSGACKKQTSILHCCHMNNYCLLLSLLSIFIIILSYNYNDIYIAIYLYLLLLLLLFYHLSYPYIIMIIITYQLMMLIYIYISILHHVNHCSPAWTTIIRGTQVLPPLSMACVVDFLLHQEVESTKQHQEIPRSTGLEHSTSVQLQVFFCCVARCPLKLITKKWLINHHFEPLWWCY